MNFNQNGFLGSRAAFGPVRVPRDHGGGHRDWLVSCRHPCHPEVRHTISLLHIFIEGKLKQFLLVREQELHEKDAEVSSWDFLSSALPVVEASEEDLSWFGMSLHSAQCTLRMLSFFGSS